MKPLTHGQYKQMKKIYRELNGLMITGMPENTSDFEQYKNDINARTKKRNGNQVPKIGDAYIGKNGGLFTITEVTPEGDGIAYKFPESSNPKASYICTSEIKAVDTNDGTVWIYRASIPRVWYVILISGVVMDSINFFTNEWEANHHSNMLECEYANKGGHENYYTIYTGNTKE